MANSKKIVKENIEGPFFVDETCIDCDACRKFAPSIFKSSGEYSYVYRQPDKGEVKEAIRALFSCPVGCIGVQPAYKESVGELKTPMEFLPMKLNDQVYINGFNSKSSYGADSYFIAHKDGNWLVDSPRFTPLLVKKFEAMGGLKYIFISHKDDIADSSKFANHFKAQRIINIHDSRNCPDAEIILKDESDFQIGPAKVIYTPGHTQGHQCLLWDDKYLFTGDHFAFISRLNDFGCFRRHCWYSWAIQIKSIEKFLAYPNVQSIFPGHGKIGHIKKGEFLNTINRVVEWMHSVA